MVTLDDPFTLDPAQFERQVEGLLVELGVDLKEFKVQHLEEIAGSDGQYEIDITARFEALGATFLVLIECKNHNHPIKRDVVQVLNDRIRAVGAQKGMIFATVRFQSGAIEYAIKHGIALIQVADGRTTYISRAEDSDIPLPPWVPKYAGWLVALHEGDHVDCLICKENPDLLRDWLSGKQAA